MGYIEFMNKAFVKEEETGGEPLLDRDPTADIPGGARNYITPEGLRRMREEYSVLGFIR